MSLTDNYRNVQNRVMAACEMAGRPKDDVRLIAVSKTKPVSDIREIYDAGCRDFGENKVQEILEKYDQLPGDVRWHMIGHLQTNKVRQVIDKAYMIHGVDSRKLADVISREACKKGITVRILIEVNVADEETKFGTDLNEGPDLYEYATSLPGIEVCGLMTIAPYTVDAEENRQYFVDLKQLSVDIINQNHHNGECMELSMGMTGDYEVAIEEGSTMVRVGTGIFGPR